MHACASLLVRKSRSDSTGEQVMVLLSVAVTRVLLGCPSPEISLSHLTLRQLLPLFSKVVGSVVFRFKCFATCNSPVSCGVFRYGVCVCAGGGGGGGGGGGVEEKGAILSHTYTHMHSNTHTHTHTRPTSLVPRPWNAHPRKGVW